MRFPFNEEKTAQAAAFLLRRHGGRLNYMVLIKLLYLADRKALIDRGAPITGDRMVSMDNGPVLSIVLDLINWGETPGRSSWFNYISAPSNYEVSVSGEESVDKLSTYELTLLEQIDDKFGKMDKWSLVRFTHGLPEWTSPDGSSIPIQPADVLRAADVSPDVIRAISREAESAYQFHRLLSAT